jgi:hypothetical protein
MAYTAQFFAEKLNVGVEYFNPFRNIQIAPSVQIEELEKVAHSFGEVVGLGLRNLAQCPVELNLVPKSIRTRQQFDQKKPYFIAAIFSLVLVVFAYGMFYNQVAKVKQASLEDLSTKLQPLQASVSQLEEQENRIKSTTNEIQKLTDYLQDEFYWPDTLAQIRSVLVRAEDKATQPGRPVGVWIEKFGTESASTFTPMEEQQSGTPGISSSMMYYLRDPALARRYFPQLFKGGNAPILPQQSTDTTVTKPSTTSTNTATVEVRLRALNLEKSGESGANSALAFAVQDEFKKNPAFDSDGTKLSGEIEKVETTADTFTFGLTLKLKNPMKTI